ncbi:hypothetical protein QBC35DRAFT_207047 [Podospora australis]|uniref:Mid2 domain-containing protein n=1 Tax=Podospora australis TaxID=1536484 RepID=A0AAN7AK04_9PEZI|nr:hypothetical protein QBC35DRAFT_207047 [Podospora australis]
MPRGRVTLRATALAAIWATASAIPTNEIFGRQDQCLANFKACGIADIPGNFCCPNGQNCIVLAGNTTVLCCPNNPSNANCKKIQTIPCDISQQDASKNQDAVVKTTALDGTLPKCGDNCCPFGYSCSNDLCVRDGDQSKPPQKTGTPTSRPSSTGTSKPSSTATESNTITGTSTPAESNEAAVEQTNEGPPIAGIAGGAAAGAVILIIIAVLAFIFLRKKKEAESQHGSPLKLSRTTSSFGNIISAPILNTNNGPTVRTDFARASPPLGDNEAPIGASVTGAMLDVRSSTGSYGGIIPQPPPAAAGNNVRHSSMGYGYYGMERSPDPFVDMPDAGYHGGGGYDANNNLVAPRTPRQYNNYREPSSVSINIFADPNITPDRTPESNNSRRYTDMTTFTQMLDDADLGNIGKGESYVPYGGASNLRR